MEELNKELVNLTFLLVIATFSAAFVALFVSMFGEWLKSLAFKPKLELLYDHKWPDAIQSPFNWKRINPPTEENNIQGTCICYYFRFRVKNKGNRPANNIEVFVNKIEEQNVDKSFKSYESFIPLNLKWSNTQSKIYLPSIYPKLEKHCDLGFVLQPQQNQIYEIIQYSEGFCSEEQIESNIIFSIDFVIKPNVTESYNLKPGTYRIEVIAVASNSKQCKKTFELTFIDKWFDNTLDMLSQGIGLKLK
ncbi:MAG TPA: hypothetical protein VM123_13905 [archaeon]|nr:hypothetical protein [archaeon]